jgi:hypothetical protein
VTLRVLAYLFVVAMGAMGLWRVEHTANALAQEARIRADEQCVSAWATRGDIRDGVEKAAQAGAEALITIANADPARIDAYRAAVAAQVQVARDQIEDPDCDLAAARRRLNQ